MAGVDLKKLKDEDIIIENDSITLMLPSPQVLNTILNPSDFETFSESGTWNTEEVTQIKMRMRDKIVHRANAQNLLPKAAERCKMIIENFLRNLDFKTIEIKFKDQSP